MITNDLRGLSAGNPNDQRLLRIEGLPIVTFENFRDFSVDSEGRESRTHSAHSNASI